MAPMPEKKVIADPTQGLNMLPTSPVFDSEPTVLYAFHMN